MFNKILIANRGEIACRIIKTARRLGIETVAVYSTADKDALHVKLADQAFCIGEPATSASYLNIDAIIKAATLSGAQAIHPGYGFLSENPDFARACTKANLVFIGPSIEALNIMGSKQLAKQTLEKTDVPLTPGYHGVDQSDETLFDQAVKLGFPVLLKAANGGGGKGMRAVFKAQEFKQALDGARREATAFFANDTLLIEKLIQTPRHIEIQLMADNHGQVVHLFERDCSIQRRHQKIVEEAPAANLPEELRQRLANAAITVAKAIHYSGAGTIEFLVENNTNFYFMEMNTRLQVEHPVTEMITGLDLVEWQLRIAANEPLPCKQQDIKAHGHAIECRIYAEDPNNNFMPSIGQLHFLQEPHGEGVRIDTGVSVNASISMHYDPMISNLITWGETRADAQHRMDYALKHYFIGGVKTNIPFLQAILQHPKFINAELSTHFLNEEQLKSTEIDESLAIAMAACVDYVSAISKTDPLLSATFAWQMHLTSQWILHYAYKSKQNTVRLTAIDPEHVKIEFNQDISTWRKKKKNNILSIDNGTVRFQAHFEPFKNTLHFYSDQGCFAVERFDLDFTANKNTLKNNQLTAPMPATVVAILKSKGETIKAGECIMVLEAMKMEHSIHAPSDGILSDIFFDIGNQVNEGVELVALETKQT